MSTDESMPGNGASSRLSALDVRRNVPLLALCQFLFYVALSVELTLTALAGLELAPTLGFATLPLALMTIVAMVSSYAAGSLVAHFGARLVLAIGVGIGVLGGLLCAFAVTANSFVLFCIGTALAGGYKAAAGYFRFIAADSVPSDESERAVSIVLSGGVAAAITGPFAATALIDVFSVRYLGSYMLVGLLAAMVAPLILLVRPSVNVVENTNGALAGNGDKKSVQVRQMPVSEVWTSRNFINGISCLAVAGCVMTLLMAVGPIGSAHAGHAVDEGAFIIQWHMVGMFAPSLLTLRLRKASEPLVLAAVGAGVLLAGAAAGVTGTSVTVFTVSLALVGVGWNLLYLAGSGFIVRCYPRGTGARIQGGAEGTAGLLITLTSFSAGFLFEQFGWRSLNGLALAPALLLLIWFVYQMVYRMLRSTPSLPVNHE